MQIGNIDLNYKMLPKQELLHLFSSLRFTEFTAHLQSMTKDILKSYLNLIDETPSYVLFGGARGRL